MKKSIRTILGVTLLEIMLVLAIAAMVIVLSIRYYSTATASSQANAMIGTFQAIIAASSNMALGTGTYVGVTDAALQTVLTGTQYQSPWGTSINTAGTATSFAVTVNASTPKGVCALVLPKLKADPHTTTATCTDGGTITFSYVPNP